jgi:predicted dehydrogenase
MSDQIRIAMIGAGGMANSVHYPSLASFDDVEIAAICDLDEERLTKTADQYGVEARYDDYQQMVADIAPDGVYVIGQPHIMYDIWIWCLQQGLNLYIEKPMGLTWHQAQMLESLAEQKGVVTQVSHQRRSSPLLRKMRAACMERGAITHAVCEFFKSQMSPTYGPRDHMMDDCTHSIDTLRWMCGGEVVDIDSTASGSAHRTSIGSAPRSSSTAVQPAFSSTAGRVGGAYSASRCTRPASIVMPKSNRRRICTETAIPPAKSTTASTSPAARRTGRLSVSVTRIASSSTRSRAARM